MSKGNIHFLFHGSNITNHESIFNQGFLVDKEHFGDTDEGYIGKGVYFLLIPSILQLTSKTNMELAAGAMQIQWRLE